MLCFKYENEFENDGLEIGQLCHPREMYRTVSVFNYFPKKVYFYLRVKKKKDRKGKIYKTFQACHDLQFLKS